MTYTGLQLFMEKLHQLIYCNNNPLINNHPSILSERPQIQLLYEELSSMIQTFFVDKETDLHEFGGVRNLKRRFKDVAEEAHAIIDLFVFDINFGYNRLPDKSHVFETSLNLEAAMRSIKEIHVDFITILDNMKVDFCPITNRLKTQSAAAGTSCTRNLLEKKKVSEDVVVGLNDDTDQIRNKLTEDRKQLDVVSIVGMGGLGKTTLATKVFNDPFVVYHFHVRAWVTVSQTYEKRDLLHQILTSIGNEQVSASDLRLTEKLHKSLKFRRYLIVIDDIWSNEAWDELIQCLPNDNTGSRILLTSRLKEVALHAKSNGFIHHLSHLTEKESWELLRKKVFHDGHCPGWLDEPGMQIARNCHGLPLAVVVIAGVLAKDTVNKDFWEIISKSVGSCIISDQNGCLETLALSYYHLPYHLRDCFLYLGGFPEDHKFQVPKLIRLWMAEGFIQRVGDRSLEEIAEDYLMDLVHRNLVVVADRKFNGDIKSCFVHDVLRELCLEKAKGENFFLKIDRPLYYCHFEVIIPGKPHRIITNNSFYIQSYFDPPAPSIRSLRWFGSMINPSKGFSEYFYALLMVLDIESFQMNNDLPGIASLVHLRYLAIWCDGKFFPSSICHLWSLQTLIVRLSKSPLTLPTTISNLVNLRHLWCYNQLIYFPSIKKPMNLQTISRVVLVDEVMSWVKCFPNIKKLTCLSCNCDLKSLTSLETLKWVEPCKYGLRLPASLKKLTLVRCHLPWSDMSLLQLLPKLEVLKLLNYAFVGHRWETGEMPFPQLKFFKLQLSNIRQWKASSINFPCLRRLVLAECEDLEEIPLELGDISTLERIEIDESSRSVVESLDKIREEQHNEGNYELELKINVRKNEFSDIIRRLSTGKR